MTFKPIMSTINIRGTKSEIFKTAYHSENGYESEKVFVLVRSYTDGDKSVTVFADTDEARENMMVWYHLVDD